MMNHKVNTFFKSTVTFKVEGKKVERFLSYLYRLNIIVLDVKYINRNQLLVKIYNKDVDLVLKIKSTYGIDIIKYGGIKGIKGILIKNQYLLGSLLIGYLFLLFLTSMIFDVEVIHTNKSLRDLVLTELNSYNISPWHLKKNYNELETIKEHILKKYQDKIEWLEIENVGTKYIVKLEERKIPVKEEEYTYQDIVSSKNAIIVKIEATSGVILKGVNDYVKKGEVLISGKIMNGEEVSKIVKASGRIYGEVWYNIKVEIPIKYKTLIKTGKEKVSYTISFLNYKFSLFNSKKYKEEIVNKDNIFWHNVIPFGITKNTHLEVNSTDEIYTDGEALIKAQTIGENKMRSLLDEDEHIISKRNIKYYVEDDKLFLDMFFKVYENIGENRQIIE